MVSKKRRDPTYRSVRELEKELYPSSFNRRLLESMDLEALAIKTAKESLREVQRQLSR
ncbi:MAG TPA: hypothetical protein VM537_04805 [Anaerolineae bacterium]|nr:hypothetical protein [Anaerolineae bacterium]